MKNCVGFSFSIHDILRVSRGDLRDDGGTFCADHTWRLTKSRKSQRTREIYDSFGKLILKPIPWIGSIREHPGKTTAFREKSHIR